MLKVPAVVALVSLSLVTAYAFAENNSGDEAKREDNKQQMETNRENSKKQNEVKHEDNKNNQGINQENGDHEDGDNNGMNDQEESDNEISLHGHFAQIPDVKTVITVPQIDVTKVNTYADIVTILNQYRDIINQIKDKGNVIDIASSTLSTQEKAILSKISSKHFFEFSRTNVRADELLAQIKDLTDALVPLGVKNISTELNLKNLLISQLNDFTATINSLTDLVDTTSTIIDEETN